MRKESTFNQDFDENLICRSHDACLCKRGMTGLNGITFLFCLLSSVAHAECVPAPDCGELGYTATSCEGGFVRCPFDISKLRCMPCDSVYQYSCTNAGEIGKGNSCNGKYIECSCADGYEVDGTGCKLSCATTYQYTCTGANEDGGSGTACGGKYTSCTCATNYTWSGSACVCDSSFQYTCSGTNITGGSGTTCGGKYKSCSCANGYGWRGGICQACENSCTVGNILYSDGSCNSCVVSGKTAIGVVVKNKELVLSQRSTSTMWWSNTSVDTSLTNYVFKTDAKTDFNGKSNTTIIITDDTRNIAAKYCNDYTTTGTSAGDWYLPAAGELYSYVYPNYNAIITAMTSIGWTLDGNYLWSSSEYSYSNAWGESISSDIMDEHSKSYNKNYVSCFLPINVSAGVAEPCDSSYKYVCSGTGYSGGSGSSCGGLYQSCICASGYEWDSVNNICKAYCAVGDIFYTDMTCSTDYDSYKTAIGIIVKDNELVLSQSSSNTMYWSNACVNTSLDNLNFDQAETDFNGKSNTATIIAEDSSNVPAKYCNDYTTDGTNAGDWYLPAAGELYNYVYGNYNTINTAITKLGWTWGSFWYWSSSEFGDCYVVGSSLSSGGFNARHKIDALGPVSCFLEISN